MSPALPTSLPDPWPWVGKLAPPHTLLTSLTRVALLTSLHEHGHKPLILLVAPAGYGKTSLMMQWRQVLMEQPPDARVAWLSLDESDGEPLRFLACLILALERAGLAMGYLSQLASEQTLDLPPQHVLSKILQILARNTPRITLLLDDFHVAASIEVDRLIHKLMEQATPWLQLMVASRTRPNWPLGRWKTFGWVHEVSAGELVLSPEETRLVLGNELNCRDLEHLQAITEGWPVAVQLARLWLTSSEGSTYGLSGFSGQTGNVAEYLAEQVLTHLSPECQSLLLDTALLECFNAEMADAVRNATNSALLLAQLSPLDTLLVPLDAGRQWFRYHGLLSEFLQSRVNGQRRHHVHRTAALWLARHKDWIRAITHALKASDSNLAVGLVIQGGGWTLILRHGIRYGQTLIRLFDETTRNNAPDLLLLQAYLHAKLGDHALATELLLLAERVLHEDPRLVRDAHVIRQLCEAYVDRFEPQTFNAGIEQTDALLSQATLDCVHTLAALHRGEPNAALQLVRVAQAKMALVASPRGEHYCRMHEAQALALSGSIAQASETVDAGLAFTNSHFGQGSSLSALVGCLKAQHLYWQAEWSAIPALLEDGWNALEHADGWLDIVATTAEVTWRTALRNQGLQAALHVLEHTSRLASARRWLRLERLVLAWRVDLLVQCGLLTQGRKEALAGDLESAAACQRDWRNQEAATLALTRLQIAGGAAGAALNRLRHADSAFRARSLLLPAWRLQLMALAAQCKVQPPPTPEHITRTFAPIPLEALPGLLLETGPSLLLALQNYTDAPLWMPAIIKRLRGWRAHPARPLSPLSGKETRILALLASGQSNKIIARALDISENTVKFHLKQVFAKLAVGNRTAAVSAAMQRGLLASEP